jgi:uncharacterized protein
MPLPGVYFADPPPPERPVAGRADVALFAGLVKRRDGPLPAGFKLALTNNGWTSLRSPRQIEALLDVPVPIESVAQFESVFAADGRRLHASGAAELPSALGAAVRSFFNEGGRKCYVVRCGDPVALSPEAGEPEGAHCSLRRSLIDWPAAMPPSDAAERAPIVPGWNPLSHPSTFDVRRTWHGIAHVLGLDDVAMVCAPDLPDLLSVDPSPLPDEPEPAPPRELFKPCAPDAVSGAKAVKPPPLTAPRLDEQGFRDWSRAINLILDCIKTSRGGAHRRDVMLIAGLPLTAGGRAKRSADAERDPGQLLAVLANRMTGVLDHSAFLQLAYPWIETEASAALPEGIENPEGALAGVIARNALSRGAFRSAANLPMRSVRGVFPILERAQVERSIKGRGASGAFASWLGDRVSLIGRGIGGFNLLSDATMSDDPAWRAGGVSRLMGIVIRAGRGEGQDLVFEASGEATWTRLRRRLEEFLTELWRLGALNGASPGEAFEVRCGRQTMTQADIDAGRLIAEIIVTAAQPIERITVTLSLGGEAGFRRAA